MSQNKFLKRISELIYSSEGAGVKGMPGTFMMQAGARDAAIDIERRGGLQATEIASMSIKWRATQVSQPYMQVEKLQPNGSWQKYGASPLSALLQHPNNDRTMRDMLQCTDISLALYGNAYWIISRNEAGIPVGLTWVSSSKITPFWDMEGKDFISGYAYYPASGREPVLYFPEDVLHFRDGVDERNIRFGHAPLKPFLNTVGADISMTEYEDTIMRNMGIPGAVITPKPDSWFSLTLEKAAEIKKKFKQMVTGKSRGEPLVLDYPADITFPNVTPSNMSIEVMRRSPEIRIPAALGINAVAVGLDMTQTGLNSSKKEFIRQAWDYGVTPIHDLICDVLGMSLVPSFMNANKFRVRFIYDDVPFLKEDESELHKRAREDWMAGGITLDEYRAMTRFPPDVTSRGDMYYNEFVNAQGGNNNQKPQSDKTGGSNG